MQAAPRAFVAAFLVSLTGALAAAEASNESTASPSIGRWKLNAAKSTPGPTPLPRSEIRTYEDWGGGLLHAVVEGVDALDKPTFREYVARFDERSYPWVRKGSQAAWTIALRRIDPRSFEFTGKEDGHVSHTGTHVVSPDGKVLTVTFKGTNLQGQPVGSVLVFDRQ